MAGYFNIRVDTDTRAVDQMADRARAFRYQNTFIRKIAEQAFHAVMVRTPGIGVVRSKWKIAYNYNTQGMMDQAIIYNTYDPQEVLTFLEFGTKPHVINPGKKGFLAFEVDGRFIVTKKPVHHPGTIAYNMITDTHRILETKKTEFLKLYAEMYARHLEGR
jgi:hypothetical protein